MNYTANNLNQYTQRTIPDGIDILGSAETNATVTVNNSAVTRHGKYWQKAMSVNNANNTVFQDISVVGVYNPPGTNAPDIVSSETGHVFVAKTPETFAYDNDGNMLTDGRFNYAWDCENRLIGVETRTGLPSSVPRVQLAFTYDYMSRRVSKTVYEWISGSWLLKQSSRFLYDGWNLVSEVCAATGKGTVTDYYVWGLDLSGSLQGAGGVGGLLARYRSVTRFYDDKGMLIICHRPPGNPKNAKTLKINESAWPAHQAHGDTLGACDGSSVSNSAFLYTFDANGNVSELLLAAGVGPLASVAHYEYSPFGETIVTAGPEAFDNPFRFSTKYFVDELGIGDWGRRWYIPPLGRWLSRDPLLEIAFKSLNLQFLRSKPSWSDAPISVLERWESIVATSGERANVPQNRRLDLIITYLRLKGSPQQWIDDHISELERSSVAPSPPSRKQLQDFELTLSQHYLNGYEVPLSSETRTSSPYGFSQNDAISKYDVLGLIIGGPVCGSCHIWFVCDCDSFAPCIGMYLGEPCGVPSCNKTCKKIGGGWWAVCCFCSH